MLWRSTQLNAESEPSSQAPPPCGELVVERLSLGRVGEPPVFENVSLVLERGEIGILTGRSGIGKTLLFHAILGLLPRATWEISGSIRINGHPIPLGAAADRRGVLPSWRDSVMAVFQEPTSYLHPSLPIGWQLKEMEKRAGRRWGMEPTLKGQLIRRLHLVGVPKNGHDGVPPRTVLSQRPAEFAEGERQRIMLAMALFRPLILADEPTSSLDEQTEREIIALLTELRRAGELRSMLIITHNPAAFDALEPDRKWELSKAFHDEPATLIARSADPEPTPTRPRPATVSGTREPHVCRYCGRGDAAASAPPILLSVQGLSASPRADGKAFLEDVNFTVQEGEGFAIRGRSASGKTSLVKAVLGLIPARATRIRLSGEPGLEVRRPKPGWAPQIQMIFQDALSTFNPRMTIGDSFAEILRCHRVTDPAEQASRIHRVLELLGLETSERVLGRLPRSFAGGQRQRLGVARALIVGPRLLIADEPFTNQDPATADEMVRLFDDLREGTHALEFIPSPMTLILISHRSDLVERLCTTAMTLDAGRVQSLAPIH